MKKVFLMLSLTISSCLFSQQIVKINTKPLTNNQQVKEIMRALNGHLGQISYKSSYGNSKVYIGYF